MRRTVLWMFCLLVCGAWADRTVVATVASGETLTLEASDARNGRDKIIVLEGGATLALGSDTLKSFLQVTGGVATLSAPADVETLNLVGGLYEIDAAAGLSVTGAKRLTVGEQVDSYSWWPSLNATNISFTATDAAGLVLTNRLLVQRMPEGLPFTVAPDSWLAFLSSNVLAQVAGTTPDALASFTVRDWNLIQLLDDVFPSNTTVTVCGGRTFIPKPCTVTEDNNWAGVRSTRSNNTTADAQIPPFSHVTNVVLASDAGGRARILFNNLREMDVLFDITGDGDFVYSAGALKNERLNVDGTLAFTGPLSVKGLNDGLVVRNQDSLVRHTVTLAGEKARFQYFASGVSELALSNLTVTSSTATLYMTGATHTWRVGTLSGPAICAGEGLGYTTEIVRLTGTVAPRLSGGAVVRLLSADAGTRLATILWGSGTELVLDLRNFDGETVPPIDVAQHQHLTVLGGAGKTLTVTGAGLVSAPDCDHVAIQDEATTVHVPTNETVTVTGMSLSWTNKVTQWYDASVASTLGGYPKNADGSTVVYTNDYPIICRWYDRRGGGIGRVHLYNGRSLGGELDADGNDTFKDRHDEVNPFVVKGGLNGLDYVSCGTYQKSILAKWRKPGDTGTVTEARRLMLVAANAHGGQTVPSSSVSPAMAILVFGSAQGGGAAVLGNVDGGARDTTLGKPFFKSGDWPMYVDGVATNGATACPNGGWQILSIPLSGKTVKALGWNTDYYNAGGQDYAEVIFFATTPTDAERQDCEAYLAAKWGLAASCRSFSKSVGLAKASGTGTLVLGDDLSLEGGFRGTVRVPAGKTLILTGGTPPPDESVVPAANRVRWFDPDLAGSIVHQSTTDRPLNVGGLYPRDANGVVTTNGALSGLTSGSDRRPWANASARDDGPVRTWLDYGNKYEGDNSGNTLRFQTKLDTGSTAATSFGDVREGFMVLDTSRGGGTPLGIDVSCSTTYRDGSGKVASCPIWPSRPNLGVLTNVTTRLDDRVLDGKALGFRGRPEVFEFTCAAAWKPAFLGFYGAGENQTGNSEVIGESIFYSTPLAADVRAQVTAYLAYKWFGKVMTGYTDLSQMTVDGAGRVEVTSAAAVPKLAATFTGTVGLVDGDLSFTVDARANRTAATNAWTACTLALPSDATVTVTVAAPLAAGAYTLVSSCTCAGRDLPRLVLVDEGQYTQAFLRNGVSRLSLVLRNGALTLDVPSLGTAILVR